ncbi:MAG TPA: ATP-binding protein [Candidatus Deferrimicrobium sp.]|nr:ATP-binding protein [Candidatus Deferrimicrobium sp.]
MKIKISKSIRSRLTILYAGVLALIFIVSDIVLYQSFKMSLIEAIDGTLLTAAEETESTIARIPIEKWKTRVKEVERGFVVNRLFIQVVEIPTGKEENFPLVAKSGVLAGNISQRIIWENLARQFPAQPLYMNVNEESPATHPLRIILYPVYKVKDKKYLIEVGSSLKKVSNTLKNFREVLVISLPLLLLVSVLGGFFILTKALQPVKAVVHAAREITTEDLSLRIDSKNRKDEIGELITTFNRMISRLEHSVIQLKQFSSDASHDLKTPLTIIRGEIEIALRKNRSSKDYIKTLTSVREEAGKLETIIDNLLFLSRLDSPAQRLSLKPVPLDEIILNVFEKAEQLANKKGIIFIIGEMEPTLIRGDVILLSRLVMNILDNAIKYTPAGGRVEISLEKTGENVFLIVHDTGVGIPGDSLPYIFDRFYQVDKSRSQRSQGSGLGLSIVKKIADIHTAVVDVQSEVNKGTAVRVRFMIDTY